MYECVQYVSALRPPEAHTLNSGSREAGAPAEGRRRLCSLTYQGSPKAPVHTLPRRSLHNEPASGQPNWSVEEELKRRRRLAGFDQTYGQMKRSDSDFESGDTKGKDVDEWKQVIYRKNMHMRFCHIMHHNFNVS